MNNTNPYYTAPKTVADLKADVVACRQCANKYANKAKWLQNMVMARSATRWANSTGDLEAFGPLDCALCHIYMPTRDDGMNVHACENCPVALETGHGGCVGSPYGPTEDDLSIGDLADGLVNQIEDDDIHGEDFVDNVLDLIEKCQEESLFLTRLALKASKDLETARAEKK